MAFQKDNKNWDNSNSRKYWFKKGIKPAFSKKTRKKLSTKAKTRQNRLWKNSEYRKRMIEKYKGRKNTLGKHWKVSEKAKTRLRGRQHWNWKGGRVFNPYPFDWTETLRRSIRERDNYICQFCSQYGDNVHHIDYDKNNCNPTNLITLCRSCNSRVNKNRNYWKKYFKSRHAFSPFCVNKRQ